VGRKVVELTFSLFVKSLVVLLSVHSVIFVGSSIQRGR